MARRTRAVIVNGKTYQSLSKAASRFRIGIGSVAHRCASKLPTWSGWKYASRTTTRRPSNIRVMALGKIFKNIREAVRETGLSMHVIKTRLADPTAKNCTYVGTDGRRSKNYKDLMKPAK